MAGVRRYIVSVVGSNRVRGASRRPGGNIGGGSSRHRSPSGAVAAAPLGMAIQIGGGPRRRLRRPRGSLLGLGLLRRREGDGAPSDAPSRGLSGVREVAVGFGRHCALMLDGSLLGPQRQWASSVMRRRTTGQRAGAGPRRRRRNRRRSRL